MRQRFLVRRVLYARRAPAVAVFLLAAVLAAGLAGVLTVRASAARAVADTTRTDHAGHRFAVQVLNDSAVGTLAARPDLLPVWEERGSAATATRLVPVTVRSISRADAAPGVLVDGRRPAAPGEATASQAVLKGLGAAVGHMVTVTVDGQPRQVRVTGVTVSPADRRDATVVVFAPGDPHAAALWISNTDVFADPQLRPILERREAKGRTVEIFAGEREAVAINTLLAALRFSALPFALLAVCLAGIMLAALHRERRPDVLALAAAGMPTRQGWRLLATAAAACLTAGSMIGVAVVLVASFTFREAISAPLGQHWQSIAVPWPALVAYVALFAPAALAMAWVTGRGHRTPRLLSSLRLPAWAGAVLILPGVAALGLLAADVVPVEVTPIAGITAVVGAVLLLAMGLTATRRPALRRLLGHSVRPLMAVAIAAAAITFGTSYYTARQEHSAQTIIDENVPYQPRRSLFIEGINADTRHTLQQRFRALGGQRSVAYLAVAESRQLIRATNAKVVTCMQQRGTTDPNDVLGDCGPANTMSPINTIALTDDPPTAELHADHAFVQDGRAGLLTFPGGGPLLASATDIVPAQPDPMLGGNLPGAVVGVDSPLARQLNLTPSGGQSLLLVDFADLPEDAQAEMRAVIARLASAAMVGEDRDDTEAQFRAVGTAATVGATSIVMLLLTTTGMTFLAAQRHLRRTLGHLGINRRQRRVVGARMLLLPIAAQIVAMVLGIICAWLAGARNDSGFGWLWILPGFAGMTVCLAVTAAYGRPPRPDPSEGRD